MATDNKSSILVDELLPEFLDTEGPKFKAFMRAYYEWLETTNQITDRSKNLLKYGDIDTTDDEFINITEHLFVPKVLDIIRTKEEIEKFASDENINVSILPRMMAADKLVKFYRGKPGDIFKLERKITTDNLMINSQIIYRRVV